jgi:hypothetical protein
MTTPADKRAASKRAVDDSHAQELSLAEERGAARVREELRAAVAEHRRVVRVRDQQVEVVETAALGEILDGR